MNENVPLLDLRTDHWNIILDLLKKHVPGQRVVAFGSRATWTAKEYSDLDLAILWEEDAPGRIISALSEGFEESNLPFKVDIVDWSQIEESLRTTIRRDGVVLQISSNKAEFDSSVHKESRPLRELVNLTLSSVDKKSKPHERQVLLCNYMDVYSNAFIQSNLEFMPATATDREFERCSVRVNDVLITKDSEEYDDIGVPAIVKENVPNLLCGYHLAILRPFQDVLDGTYLYYALQIPMVQRQFHAYANGVTRFSLRKDDILRIEVPFHELPQQRTIGRFLTTLDQKIALNQRMNETLEAIAQTLFKDWFVNFGPVHAKMRGWDSDVPHQLNALFPNYLIDSEIGAVPNGWNVRPLSEMFDINPKRCIEGGEILPYLDMANMPIDRHVPHKIVDRVIGSGAKFMNGDTLLARITPCLENGKVAFVNFLQDEQIGWGSTEFIVLRPKFPLPNEFAYFLAKSPRFREFAIKSMTGTSGRQRVQRSSLEQFLLPVPTSQIASMFGDTVRPLLERGAAAVKESHSLANLRDTLLPKLVSGEICIKDATRTLKTLV